MKNEGNKHVVLGVRGTGSVLRLAKHDGRKKPPQIDLEAVERYNNLVMSSVLGPFLGQVQVLQLSPEQLEAARNAIFASTGQKVDLKNPRTLLMEDALYLPPPAPTSSCSSSSVISFEFRFKYCAVGNDQTGRQCNNCYHDSEKPRRPGFAYCPYEIFSGDRARMARCLRRLMDTPDKFMMIFQDGKLVDDEVK